MNSKTLVNRVLLFSCIISLAVFWSTYSHGYRWGKKAVKSYRNSGNAVRQTDDGGYIIAGTTWILGGMYSNVLLIKTDAGGNEVWSKSFRSGDVNRGHSLQRTIDGGYIIAGTTWPHGQKLSDVYLIKTDAEGNEVWSKTLGGSGRDYGYSVQEISGGGYVVAGQTDSFGAGKNDIYLIKTDAEGNEVWSRTFGGSGRDYGYSVQESSDGGYVVVGQTDSFGAGKDDIYLIKTDAEGNEVWSKTFGGSGRDYGRSVQQAADGGYIIAGTTYPPGASYSDICLIKTDNDGNKTWYKVFGKKYGDQGYSVQKIVGGGYIIVGSTCSHDNTGSSDIYLIKTDAEGNEVWNRTFVRYEFNCGYSVRQTVDNGYIIVGKTASYGVMGNCEVYLLKSNADGDKIWSKILRLKKP